VEDVTEQRISKAKRLNEIAAKRGQSLAQMAIAWLLKDPRVTSVLVGVSSVEQLDDNLKTLKNLIFSGEELEKIESILNEK
jgi:L-glyceraldehyde 3-phosphate reductase